MALPSEKPNIKPFRHLSQFEIVNMFAHVSGEVNAGTFVVATVADPDSVAQSYGSFTNMAGTPSYAQSFRASVPWKVRTATSGELPLGMTLNDIREFDPVTGGRLALDYNKVQAMDIIVSGNSVPIATRGVVEINGFSGAPGPHSGAVIHPTVPGQLLVTDGTDENQVGKFLTSSGADGYALFKIEL